MMMTTGGGDLVCGILRRFPGGQKLLFPGHRGGVYWPTGLPLMSRIYVVEGGSDVAAALTVGLPAIGRFSCSHGRYLIRAVLDQSLAKEAIVVADVGNQAERQGAEDLAGYLARVMAVRLIVPPPPYNDLRQWIGAGATREHIEHATEEAARWS
jgi:hypothetical protein